MRLQWPAIPQIPLRHAPYSVSDKSACLGSDLDREAVMRVLPRYATHLDVGAAYYRPIPAQRSAAPPSGARVTKSRTKVLRDPKPPVEPPYSRPYCAPLLASADGAPLGSAGGGAVFATAGVAFFTTGLAALERAAGFAGLLPQKLNRDDSGAVSLTPPA